MMRRQMEGGYTAFDGLVSRSTECIYPVRSQCFKLTSTISILFDELYDTIERASARGPSRCVAMECLSKMCDSYERLIFGGKD